MKKLRALCSWSGGKDSCFALMAAISNGYEAAVLLNVLNEDGKISRSHGIPSHLLQKQADAAGIPVKMISSSWQDYEKNFTLALEELKSSFQVSAAVFGDIDLQEHRDWEEKVCNLASLEAVLPLWKKARKELVLQMIDSGIRAVIVSCNTAMGKKFIGKTITRGLVIELEKTGIDPCGENGEYHTLVVDCPLFKQPVEYSITGSICHNDYWFAQLS